MGEFDDDPQHFAELVRSDFFALRSCHCLQTTTELMAETLRAFNPHVAVFPNQVAVLPAPRPQLDDKRSPGQLTIFFGALNREADWAPLMPTLNGLLNGLGPQVRVQVVYDQAFFEALSTSCKAFEPLCAYDRYHELLHAADIALLPLEPTRFNQHKSDLKFIECAAHGVAALASSTVYGRTIIHDEDRPGLSIVRRVHSAARTPDSRCPDAPAARGKCLSLCSCESIAITPFPHAI